MTSDGPNLRKVIDKSEFQGVQLTDVSARSFSSARGTMLEKLHEALTTRFGEFSSHTSIIRCTRIADLRTWPQNWDSLRGSKLTIMSFIQVGIDTLVHILL